MPDGPEVSITPAIPAPRRPEHDAAPVDSAHPFPGTTPAAEAPAAAESGPARAETPRDAAEASEWARPGAAESGSAAESSAWARPDAPTAGAWARPDAPNTAEAGKWARPDAPNVAGANAWAQPVAWNAGENGSAADSAAMEFPAPAVLPPPALPSAPELSASGFTPAPDISAAPLGPEPVVSAPPLITPAPEFTEPGDGAAPVYPAPPISPAAISPAPVFPLPPGGLLDGVPLKAPGDDDTIAPDTTRTGTWIAIAGGLVAVLVILGVVVWRPAKPAPKPAAKPAVAQSSAPVATTPATPYDRAVAALTTQSAALLRGDRSAFLAGVDKSLQSRYANLYDDLRGLGVTTFDYQPGVGHAVSGDPSAQLIRVDVAYCFGTGMCPASADTEWSKPPHIEQDLTLKAGTGGAYVISKVAAVSDPDYHQPLPWEKDRLVFAQGKRVTLATTPDQAKYLKKLLPVADAAATIDDRFAALNGTPQQRYRIFLAGESQWKTWYNGGGGKWAIGVAVPLNKWGTDVVIRLSYMDDPVVLRETLQHELGHVVTLTGAFRADADADTWLSEGIAEYIGWYPKPATSSYRLDVVRWALNGSHPPKSIVPVYPGDSASLRRINAFYGLSHFAVDCMGHKYGQTKLFDFVRLVLTEDNSYDQAAHDAFGTGFAAVDKTCMSYIKNEV